MKILHVLHELKYSGAEIMYVDAAPEFKRLGCQLYVINSADNLGEFASHFEEAGYTVLHMPYPKNILKRWNYYKSIVRLVKKEGIDVIHIHDSGMKWGMSLCAKVAGIKSVYTFHNCFPTRSITKPYHKYLRWTAKRIFGCRFQSISDDVYLNEKNVFGNETTKIYNWYGNNRFYPADSAEKKSIRKELRIAEDALVIISVGGCSPIKRHEDIINALPAILKKYPDTIYLHLGNGPTLKEEIELSKKLELSDHIRFCGNQDNVRKYLVASDIYAMPSRFEGIPITTIEAMACNIPAVLYNVKGLRNFNSEKECSVLIAEDSKLLAESLCSLFEDKALCNRISSNAKDLVDEKFFLPTNVRKIVELYK